MENTRSRSRVLGLAGLFVLTTIGMAIWVGVTVRRDTSIDSHVGEQYVGSEHPKPTTPSVADTRTTLPAVPATDVDSKAAGRLRIHCVDATSGAALPDLKWVVGTEQPRELMLAQGVTDTTGRASTGELPEGLLVVFTLRKPPHAETFTAIQLKAGESRDVEMHVGHGARIEGRVIDDLSQPLAGVDIILDSDNRAPFKEYPQHTTTMAIATRTDDQGHYLVDNVASRPSGIRIVDGELRSGWWHPVGISARRADAVEYAETVIGPGETTVLPDLVLERARGWRGHVVDADGRAVAGAVVSVNPSRVAARHLFRGVPNTSAIPPGDAHFELLPGESLTGIDGSFDLASGDRGDLAVVVTPTGTGQFVQLPSLAPGASANDVKVELKPMSSVALDLVDGKGAPARLPNPHTYIEGATVRSGRNRSYELIRLTFWSSDDVDEQAELFDDGIGGCIAQISGRIENVRSYSLCARGWESPKSESISSPLRNGGRLRIELMDSPCVRVHLRMKAPNPSAGAKDVVSVGLHACLLDDLAGTVSIGQRCCGLGSFSIITMVDGERDVLLPVDAHRPFHIYTYLCGSGGISKCVHQGVCSPDGAPISIDLDGTGFVTDHPVPPRRDADDPSVLKNRGTIRLRVVDAVTGAPVRHAFFDMSDPTGALWSESFHSSSADNLIEKGGIAAGNYTGSVTADGYRELKDLVVVVRVGETTDLGQVAVVPAPRTRIVVEEADGTHVPRNGGLVTLFGAGEKHEFIAHQPIDSDDGSATFFADVPDEWLAQISEEWTSIQWIPARREGETTVTHLAPWHDVDVSVNGAVTQLPGSSMVIRVRPESWDVATAATSASHGANLVACETRELEVLPGTPRIFRCRLAAGRYLAEGVSPLFHVASQSFEVGPTAGPVRVDLESTE